MATMLRWEPFVSRRTPDSTPNRNYWVPAADLEQTDTGTTVRMDVPGVAPDDLDVSVTDGVLAIRGSRSSGGRTLTFERRFTLPEGTPSDGIQASHDLGVLELHIPRPAEPERRRVPVEVRHVTDRTNVVEAHEAADQLQEDSVNSSN